MLYGLYSIIPVYCPSAREFFPIITINITSNSNLTEKTGYPIRNAMIQPVRENRWNGSIVGAIQCINKEEGSFTQEDEEILSFYIDRIMEELQSRYDISHSPLS
jgi:hypothetical protein